MFGSALGESGASGVNNLGTHGVNSTVHALSTPVLKNHASKHGTDTSIGVVSAYLKLCSGLVDIAYGKSNFSSDTLGSNEAMQVSAASALAHLLHGILSYTLNAYVKLSGDGASSSHSNQDTFIIDILDGLLEMVMPGLLLSVEVLKDSCVKLQQAYLNALNVMLMHCRYAMQSKEVQQHARTIRLAVGEASDSVYLSILSRLERIRIKLGPSENMHLLASTISLVEQTSSATVRAKALLCIALLDNACIPLSNEVLRQCVAENRRFLTAVVKNLESLFTANPNNSISLLFSSTLNVSSAVIPQSPDRRGQTNYAGGANATSTADKASSDYHLNCALSLIYHIANVLLTGLQTLNRELKVSSGVLAKLFESQIAPSDHSFLASLQDAVTSQDSTIRHCETVRVCLSFATNPVLFRLLVFDKHILGHAAELLHASSALNSNYRKVHALVKALPTRIFKDAEPLAERLKTIVRVTEESCLSIVETISQVNLTTFTSRSGVCNSCCLIVIPDGGRSPSCRQRRR